MLRALIVVPLLIIPITLYLLISMSAGEGGTALRLQANLFSMPMMSGGRWAFSIGDLILFIGLIFLFIEILKAARTKSDAIVNHSLSMVLLLFCVIAFLAFPGFGTSVFFLLMVMTLLDVVAGPIVSIVAARRDFGVGENISG
jgi:hypothetical protein